MIFRMFNFMNSRMDEFIEDKKDIKLILDESLLLQDLLMPQQQYKLLNYVKDHPEHLDTLIEYITDFVDEAYHQRQQYKYESIQEQTRYPFLASEILSKENDFFQDFLFEEQNLQYLNRLFSLLNEDILNITQAGYFSKVILTLLKKKHFKMLQYLNDRDISNLLKHLDVPHVAEIIEKVITPDPNDENQLLDKQKAILQRIMKIALNRYYETEIFDNCMQIINNLLKSSINPDQEELIKSLMNPYFFLTICYQSQRTSAYELVSNLLQYINNSGKTDYFLYFMDVAKHLPNAFTTTNIQAIPHQTTYGQIITPLSSNKLTLLQIYNLLLLSEKEEIVNELINNQSFQVITNLVMSHEFNNQALIWFDKIVVFIYQKLPEMFKSISQFLASTIIKYNTNEKKKVGSLQNHIKPGYQGILTKISNLLVDSHFTNEEWDQYVNDTLYKINSVEKRLLCDVDPKPRSMFQSIQDSTAIQPQKENKEEDFEVEEDIPEEDNNKENENEDSDLELDDDELDYELANLQEEKFYDCNEEGRLQQLQEMQQIQQEEPKVESKHKASSEEQELIDEQIEEIISDPQTKPEQVAQIIQNEENLIDDIGPLELENKQDHQVNEYYKKHDDPKNEE
ncbi:unnamed protein product (macronuclear) [Paramecium tetraurelia]|uniref:Serine/threonine-protein phosphatase 4 regulatory subunit 3-like central domain-containing protein n=1 Tax=Paramecium tetraurelia TaxID=5888 RepID=A0ECC1_PARTE|nr:uncharacterized protein GSPATT00025675001 [Paramecium tetraurelia]CAK92938.1 unnamed protein product [Paramecium tetraurelia]|eukprot:XP_001460335.1 hypothetical protein (macronuclear) [Paramecium tetraurelia strain d4-2]